MYSAVEIVNKNGEFSNVGLLNRVIVAITMTISNMWRHKKLHGKSMGKTNTLRKKTCEENLADAVTEFKSISSGSN